MNEGERRLEEFRQHHARNLDQALSLQGRLIVVFGCGATGSHVGAQLAHAGGDVAFIDRDDLELPNLARHYLTDPRLAGQSKAQAIARRLRAELPTLQRIRSIKLDLDALTDEQLDALLADAVLALGCTGHAGLDRRLNRSARRRGIPLVVPSMLAGQDQLLGDLQITAWNLPRRRGGCFECIRPERSQEPPPAEAQRGLASEVIRLATLTSEAALALLLPNSPQHAALTRQLDRGVSYFLIPRWPPSLRAVITHPRRGCPACSTAADTTATPGPLPTDLREWAIGGALASAVLWHQFIPGLDAIATVALIAVLGLWWRDRLASFAEVSARVRRLFRLDR